jgi:hypothetical protein
VYSNRSTIDKVDQLLAHGRWFSPAFSTTKTCCHDIAEILLSGVKHQKSNQIKSNASELKKKLTDIIWIQYDLSRIFI